jgi:type IV pilus assembly protein PilM
LFKNLLNFSQSVFGLDIGFKTMKLVQVDGTGPNAHLLGAAEAVIPECSITKNGVQNQTEIARILAQTVSLAKPRKINAKFVSSALPETLVSTKSLHLPIMSEAELKKVMPNEVVKFFPLPILETYYDYQIIDKKSGYDYQIMTEEACDLMEVLAVAAPKILVDSLIETVRLAGFELVALETKPMAASRALIRSKEEGPLLIIDIGTKSSNIACLDQGTIKVTSIISLGGNQLTANLASGTDLFVNEINHVMKYYENTSNQTQVYKKIILAGGGASIKGFAENLEKITRVKTIVGEPVIKVKNFNPKFATAIGLALKEI